MTRLTALDGTFLELEDADESAHMHIGSLLVFGPLPDGGTPTVWQVRDHLAARLDALPRYRERLAGESAGQLSWQRWVPDEHFDIADHVRHDRIPDPGGWEDLLDWGGEYFSLRLDRRRPLWEVVLLDGLGDGHWALATKTHHCMADGVGAVQAAHLLFDGVGDALRAAPHATGGDDDDEGALPPWATPRALAATLSAGMQVAAHPLDSGRRVAALAELLVREELRSAAASSINSPIGPWRRLQAVTIDLDEVRAVRRALGGKVNDVVLAGVCAGLRELLLSRGEEPPEQGLRAMVPMNVRAAEDAGALGNRISSLFVELPVAERNPIARYGLIREATAAVKASRQPLGADSLLQLTALAPPVLHQLAARSLFAKRLFNITVTNVPGPPVRLSALGAPLKDVWPLVPLAADHGIGVAIVSYDGRLTFGINACAQSVEDVDVFAAGVAEGLAELQRIAHGAAVAVPA